MTPKTYNPPPTIAELLHQVSLAKTKSARIKLLKENDSQSLRQILKLNFDPNCNFDLAEGIPEDYRGNNNIPGFGNATLKTCAKSMYVFFKKFSPGLRQKKREVLFASLLESLDKEEAQVLLLAKDKKLDIGVTRKMIEEAFPGLIDNSAEKGDEKDEEEKDSTESDSQGV
jgi:hypothetical protein